MVGYVIIALLAAIGLLSMMWTIVGFAGVRNGGVLLILGYEEAGLLRRCLWLREMGLLRCRMAVWEMELSPEEVVLLESYGVEIWKPSAQEGIGAKEHGAGTGDPPGCHQCGGVSEL